MPKGRERYPAELRRQIVELARAGTTSAALARRFGCSAQAVRNWVAQDIAHERALKAAIATTIGDRQFSEPCRRSTSDRQRVGYRRVNSIARNVQKQLDGVALDCIFTDATTGKHPDRPQLRAAMEYLRAGDTLVAHTFYRLAPTADELLGVVSELTARGIVVEFSAPPLVIAGPPSDPTRQLIIIMLAGFAQFERELLRERHDEGIARAKAKGVYKGRKKTLFPHQIVEIREKLAAGATKSDIADMYGISRRSLYEYLKD